MTNLPATDTLDICCSDCFYYREAPQSDPEREGVCLLRDIEILYASWTVCESFQPLSSEEPDSASVQPDGPVYVDAGAFPDHLQPVYNWESWLQREREKL